MTKNEFIELHGEEAYDILIKDPRAGVEQCRIHLGLEGSDCERGNLQIRVILKLLGFPEVKGLIEAQKELKQLKDGISEFSRAIKLLGKAAGNSAR